MSVAAVLAIVVAVGEAQSSTSVALMAAAEESVGTATAIRMVEVPAPSRAAGLSVERQLGAGSVVVLSWREPAHLHAVLLHHVVATDRWTIRRMSFAPADAVRERGRTLGLAVASMSPESWRPAAPPAAAAAATAGAVVRDRVPRPPAPVPTRPPAPAPTFAPTSAPAASRGARLTGPAEMTRAPPQPVIAPVASAEDPEAAPEDPGPADPAATVARAAAAAPATRGAPARAAPAAPRARTFALGLAAIGASGLGGPAEGLGGMLDGVWYVRRRLALRVGLGLRRGDVPQLPEGRDLTASAAVGLEWWVLGGARDEGWGLGVRLDALALYHRITAATGGPDASASEAHMETRPGADALVAAYLGLGRNLDLVAGAGLEVVDGPTSIRLYTPKSVATIPSFRAVGFAGLRLAW